MCNMHFSLYQTCPNNLMVYLCCKVSHLSLWHVSVTAVASLPVVFHSSTISTTPSLGSREESLPIIPQLLYGRMSSETRCQVLNIFYCNQSFQMWVIWLNSDVWMQKESPGGEWKNKIWQFFFINSNMCNLYCCVLYVHVFLCSSVFP